eukprot:gene2324-3049_t
MGLFDDDDDEEPKGIFSGATARTHAPKSKLFDDDDEEDDAPFPSAGSVSKTTPKAVTKDKTNSSLFDDDDDNAPAASSSHSLLFGNDGPAPDATPAVSGDQGVKPPSASQKDAPAPPKSAFKQAAYDDPLNARPVAREENESSKASQVPVKPKALFDDEDEDEDEAMLFGGGVPAARKSVSQEDPAPAPAGLAPREPEAALPEPEAALPEPEAPSPKLEDPPQADPEPDVSEQESVVETSKALFGGGLFAEEEEEAQSTSVLVNEFQTEKAALNSLANTLQDELEREEAAEQLGSKPNLQESEAADDLTKAEATKLAEAVEEVSKQRTAAEEARAQVNELEEEVGRLTSDAEVASKREKALMEQLRALMESSKNSHQERSSKEEVAKMQVAALMEEVAVLKLSLKATEEAPAQGQSGSETELQAQSTATEGVLVRAEGSAREEELASALEELKANGLADKVQMKELELKVAAAELSSGKLEQANAALQKQLDVAAAAAAAPAISMPDEASGPAALEALEAKLKSTDQESQRLKREQVAAELRADALQQENVILQQQVAQLKQQVEAAGAAVAVPSAAAAASTPVTEVVSEEDSVASSSEWFTGTWTTGYWDCCKPSCAWADKGNVTNPMHVCDADGNIIEDINSVSVCDAGVAGTCPSNQPWMVRDNLSYGFAAAAVSGDHGLTGDDNCGQCYQLIFTSGKHDPDGDNWGGAHPDLAGKSMVIQVTNIGYDVSGDHSFDILIPAAGQGYYTTGCSIQFSGYSSENFDCGNNYGGCDDVSGCAELPAALRSGCEWRFEWYKWLTADGQTNNPYVDFRRVQCPKNITDVSGFQAKDDSEYPADPNRD